MPLVSVARERYPNLPNVPAVVELPGFKGYVPVVWAGMVAPKGTSQTAVDRMARDRSCHSAATLA